MSGHVDEVNLPIFNFLVPLRLVQGLAYLEGYCGLGLPLFFPGTLKYL